MAIKLFRKILSLFRRKKGVRTEPQAQATASFEEVTEQEPGQEIKEEPGVKLVEESVAKTSEEALVQLVQEPRALEEKLAQKKEELEKLDATLRKYQLAREEELNAREEELVAREKEVEEKLKFEEDVKRLLKILDELLGKLPKEIVEEFASSEAYELYEKVLKRYGI